MKLEIMKPFAIQDCPFFDCALNTGKGGCVSTNTIQCPSIPEIFKPK